VSEADRRVSIVRLAGPRLQNMVEIIKLNRQAFILTPKRPPKPFSQKPGEFDTTHMDW